VLADINNLTRHRSDFTAEDRDVLESQIAIAHTPDLCLDPDPDLEDQLTAVHNRARIWNGQAFHKLAHKTSQMAASRKRKLGHFAKHRGLELLDFCKAKKSRPSRTKGARQSEEAKTVIPAPSLVEPALDPPSQPILIEELRTLTRPEITPDCTLYRIEDHILEKVQVLFCSFSQPDMSVYWVGLTGSRPNIPYNIIDTVPTFQHGILGRTVPGPGL